MKKYLLLFVSILFTLTACQQAPPPVDIDAEKTALEELHKTFGEAFINLDVETMVTYIDENSLLCGSAPDEFLTKEEFIKVYEEIEDPGIFGMKYFGDRVIKVAPDGKSAIVVEQFTLVYMPNVPVRNVYSLNKTEDKWMISFLSSSLVPKNEDVMKIAEATQVVLEVE